MSNEDSRINELTNTVRYLVDKIVKLKHELLDLERDKLKIDNIVRVNGNNFTDYDKALDYIVKLKNRENDKCFSSDVNLFNNWGLSAREINDIKEYIEAKLVKSSAKRWRKYFSVIN